MFPYKYSKIPAEKYKGYRKLATNNIFRIYPILDPVQRTG